MRKIISFMHISLHGFVAGPSRQLSGGEMNWIKVDEGIFDHVGKRISEGDTALYGRVTYFHAKMPRYSLRLNFFSLRCCV